MNIQHQIEQHFSETVEQLYGPEALIIPPKIQQCRPEYTGDFTLVVFPYLKLSKKAPEATAEEIGNALTESADIASFEVVKGFLNISVSDDLWLRFLNNVMGQEKFGFAEKGSGHTVMVEYSSPNTNKPLHLGHIRNNLLGYSVSRILEAAGHKVLMTQIINDRGIHICKSMLAWQKWGNGITPESAGIKGDKLVGDFYVRFDKEYKKEVAQLIANGMGEADAKDQAPLIREARDMLLKWESKDKDVYALWEKMNGWVYKGFDETYKRLGVRFDALYYESDTWRYGKDTVLKGLEKGLFEQEKDGSIWCNLEADGLDRKILLRSDGTAVYMTQDIGTAIRRYEDYPELKQLVYTVGNEQDYHFKVLFLILEKLGYNWAKKCYHLSYGMVDLPEGKMKSREGTVVDADELMTEVVEKAGYASAALGKITGMTEEERVKLYNTIGMGALKYFILKVDPKKRMLFNPAESVEINGNTGPFIQYTYARIRSLLRKAGDEVVLDKQLPKSQPVPEEKDILRSLAQWPDVLHQAAEEYHPAVIANWVYELVKRYNHFYQLHPILKSDDDQKKFRLALSATVSTCIRNAMALLGIEVPERM